MINYRNTPILFITVQKSYGNSNIISSYFNLSPSELFYFS